MMSENNTSCDDVFGKSQIQFYKRGMRPLNIAL